MNYRIQKLLIYVGVLLLLVVTSILITQIGLGDESRGTIVTYRTTNKPTASIVTATPAPDVNTAAPTKNTPSPAPATTAPATTAPATGINCPYDIASLSITYGYLDESSRQLFDLLYNAVRAGKTSVKVPEGMTMDEVLCLQNLFSQEASELIAFDPGNTYVIYMGYGGQNKAESISIAYRCPISEQEKYIQRLQTMGKGFAGRDDLNGILAIHDYVCGVITYGTVANDAGQRFYDSLSTGKGVCNAYAQGMTALCHFSGYKCSYLSGFTDSGNGTGGHAWNIAKVGSRYTYFDATWDDDDDIEQVYCGIGYERLYSHRQDDAGTPVFARLPKGEELGSLIDSTYALDAYIAGVCGDKSSDIALKFTPAMYARLKNDNTFVFTTLAGYGIQSGSSVYYDAAYTYILKECTYATAVRFSLSGGNIVISGLQGQKPTNFIMVTDRSVMNWCASDNWNHFYNALAFEGLFTGEFSMSIYEDNCYCEISNAKWQSPNSFRDEAEFRSILSRAKAQRLSSVTVVGELSYFERIMFTNSSEFWRILSDAGVSGSVSYYDSGIITLTGITYS